MSSVQELAVTARSLINDREYEQALQLLTPQLETQDLALLQLAAEAHLEISSLAETQDDVAHAQQAYALFQAAATKDDKSGSKGGFEKFLWLGQLSGGREAVKWFRRGCDGIKRELSESQASDRTRVLNKKLSGALCSTIEVWMTDLCMEDEAERMCDALIAEAMMVDSDSPENNAALASIRISQQRPDDAADAVRRAWELQVQAASDETDEVAEISSLKTLIKLALELSMFDVAEAACQRVIQLDDQIAEVYYLAGINYMQQQPRTRDSLTSAYECLTNAIELIKKSTDGVDDPEQLLKEMQSMVVQIEEMMSKDTIEDPANEDDEWLDVLDDE
ncbi:hypothetical protein V1512DRAFT_64968 [Lipomyces arxii]|uniref:uncharacterized protein n=1 Tax=Lipomyces arxii TaxID=56418 RepID=UPI0034CEEEDE